MVILHLTIHPCEPGLFAIFKPTILWYLIEDYIRINNTFGFFDSLSISSEVELGLGLS
jgi:hypothetical protein